MNNVRRLKALGLAVLAATGLMAQQAKGPVELRQDLTPYNLTSFRGLPISSVAGSPPGSDGRVPAQGVQLPPLPSGPPTVRQFQAGVFFGGTVRPKAALLVSGRSMVANAVSLDLPRLGGNNPTLILLRARMGAPVVSRTLDYLFGSMIQVPTTDEYGVLLPPNVRKENYWYPEPYTENNHAGAGYYWSPNARAIFATKPGVVEVVWRRMGGSATRPGPPSGTTIGIYTGGDVNEGLDLQGTFAYALNFGSGAGGLVGDANFVGDPSAGQTVTLTSGAVLTGQNKIESWMTPNFGNTANDQRLANITKSIRYSGYPVKPNVDLAVVAGTRYKLQLLFVENPPGFKRGFNVLVGGKTVAANFIPGDYVASGTSNLETKGVGVVITHIFEAASSSLRVELDGAAATDPLLVNRDPVISGLTLERLESAADTTVPEAIQDSGIWYPVLRQRLLVSGSLVKPSRPIYWTQGDFQKTGKPVSVPGSRVGDVKVVFNDRVPERVTSEYQGGSLIVTTNPVPETRTLWFERTTSQILAYNREGRVFLELLGDVKADGTRQHLGFEIVDIFQQPTPQDVRVDLGDRLKAFSDPLRDDSKLFPEVVPAMGPQYVETMSGGDDKPYALYAARETRNLNDVLVFWMEPGEQGLKWPRVLARYDMRWPVDPARYSHYLRPLVDGEDEALRTAVRLEQKNIPTLLYQDPLDQERAKITPDLRFYTYLTPAQPAHRTLLRYGTEKGLYFERVFSWLDVNLKTATWAGTLATNLTAWDRTNQTLVFAEPMVGPRLVSGTINVGDRVMAPQGELGASPGDGYVAGHVRVAAGNSYHPGAYVDPLVSGFDAASQGAIIPVNAIPGRNQLEVWWFRRDKAQLGLGIVPISWPSAIGRYTVQYPGSPREIVLASNAGTGGLDSLVAKGSIYYQNERSLPGYNPNEEHAMMIGGQGWALRDDLNITSGGDFSSMPFVLISYFGPDKRPSMAAFRVLREKASAGWLFDYVVNAGNILQAPMPLPLMPPPTEGEGVDLVNYNIEVEEPGGDLPTGWVTSDATGSYGHYKRFSIRDRKESFWVYRGLHKEPALAAGRYVSASGTFGAMNAAEAVVGRPFKHYVHASRRAEGLTLRVDPATPVPAWMTVDSDAEGLFLSGTPDAARAVQNYNLTLKDVGTDETVSLVFRMTVKTSGADVSQAPLRLQRTLADGSQVEYRGRPPYLAANPTAANSFKMRYYYKTLEGFAWPRGAVPVGTIVPYLRPLGTTPGTFEGDAASKATASLSIVYRPAWPAIPPLMQVGQTLMRPVAGLPDLESQSSAEILYQQSIGTNFATKPASVVLIDPTRAKTASLVDFGLSALPPGVLAEAYQGKFYFPNLPPHLADRVYFDPNVGPKGSLVLAGEKAGDVATGKYLRINVLRGLGTKQDLQWVLDLCPSSPADQKANWNNLVNGLTTKVETFVEDKKTPGKFIVDPTLNVTRGVGDVAEITNDDSAVDSYAMSAMGPGVGYVTLMVGNGRAFTDPGEPVSMHVFRVGGPLWGGELRVVPSKNPLNELLTLEHTPDLGGRQGQFEYEWKIGAPVDGMPPAKGNMSQWLDAQSGTGMPRFTLGGSGVQVLADNYLMVRYRMAGSSNPVLGQWSAWTEPQLAEGWVKRVLAGINPFQQRVKDLYNNAVSTDVSSLTQAGRRWEGAISLNLANINKFGLIEIYETVSRRARDLSINAGINYGPANDALLLVSGYLNDLYTIMGNEAAADAADPTISTATAAGVQNSIATARFSFAGQVGSLLEEELGLLRGRDDFMQPGVQSAPAYNRMWWNYTRGIASGEVTYAENYNIQDLNNDGVMDAADAAVAYPQGHGDAYGHYLTAVKGYYGLILNQKFDWVPRMEAVTILGKTVSVDYADERKFAAAAGAVGQTAVDVLKLVFRQSYRSEDGLGWDRFGETRANTNRLVASDRHWGLDHWASRAGQGTFIHWLVGNSMLPEVDPDPTHEGIQKIDRTTVPELTQLPLNHEEIQRVLDNAEAGLTPLGLTLGSITFDLNPNLVTGAQPQAHFDQIYKRAVESLENVAAAHADASRLTTDLASETDTLEKDKETIEDSERSMTARLIEIYGTPYTDDVGPGMTYPQGYDGPDLLHYLYVDVPEYDFPASNAAGPGEKDTFTVSIPNVLKPWEESLDERFFQAWDGGKDTLKAFVDAMNYPVLTNITVTMTSEGYTPRPDDWTGRRRSPGSIQQAASRAIASHRRLVESWDDLDVAVKGWRKSMSLFRANWSTAEEINGLEKDLLIAQQTLQSVLFANDLFEVWTENAKETVGEITKTFGDALPDSFIAGLAAGGDLTSPAQGAIQATATTAIQVLNAAKAVRLSVVKALEFSTTTADQWVRYEQIVPRERRMELRQSLMDLSVQIEDLQGLLWNINARKRELDDAQLSLRALVAQGERLQADRLAFRRRAAAMIQGYRTRDVAYRLFRNEKLDRYRTLMDLASQYALLAANAYDYDTGLLGTKSGRAFMDRIIQARALGVVKDGVPQFTGSRIGDSGLSGALAELYADWSVLKGRLGFNNPDAYGTTASLRMENHRIVPGGEGDAAWRDILQRARRDNILEDVDVRRMCLGMNRTGGLPVPGLVVEFSTVIEEGLNFFGQPLAHGDHAFSSSSFATKVFALGVALEGYKGMDTPGFNTGTVSGTGGTTPTDPDATFLDPTGMSATPYVYVIPVGLDSMRSPPLGDQGTVRTWAVEDVTVPMPFNVGASDFSSKKYWQSSDSLQEPLYALRKHQAFRPVPSATLFTANIYGGSGGLQRSQFTNSRLIGRSVWNNRWKLVVPGTSLLNNPEDGLDRFIRTVKDIKLHVVSYSYSGN